MGCAASVPDRSSGRPGGLNNLENGGAPDAKNLRVKIVFEIYSLNGIYSFDDVLVLSYWAQLGGGYRVVEDVSVMVMRNFWSYLTFLMNKEACVKLVLLGDSGVGKSCIVLRFVRGQFDPTSKFMLCTSALGVTVGASFLSQTIALQDSTTVKFEIWDTAGQERYAALAPLYYRGAAVAVIVYDITSPDSFNKAQYWVKELQKHGTPDIVMALVGNKADLQENREVSAQDGIDYAEKNGMFFIETSAKTADNINQLFEPEAGICNRAIVDGNHYNVKLLNDFPVHPHLIHDCGLSEAEIQLLNSKVLGKLSRLS
ncbi:hypothetical protein JRO89_XS14G0028800 [Xanthoceras sorbifolium]|uniref:Uncharacterized protein n=1 Tax=Xanthoceras sorbifolium TaxID=99658 RepID=A0ABQ8H3G7_9ROSI|nr:hypothetical protein JRO89_XS14G0028800 [Xanthoceras sorbifolium]